MVNQHTIKRPVGYCECGDHAWLTLSRGAVSFIDSADGEWAGQWSWSCLAKSQHRREAVRRKNAGGYFYLHREIMNAPGGMLVDHINGDSLDNRRRNLRICTERLNRRNMRPQRKATSSKFKGVYHDKARGQWQAYVNVDGKRFRLGRFDSEVEAARAYDAKAIELHGEFAKTNQGLGLLP